MAGGIRVTNRPRRSTARGAATVTGFDQLYAQLTENLPKATQRAVLQRAGKAAMKPMMDRIEETAPERTGQTRDSVRMTVNFLRATSRLGAAIRVQIGIGNRKVFWPRFAENGTVHEPARPFVRPAFDNGVGGVLGLLKAAIGGEIGKAAARRAKRLARLR